MAARDHPGRREAGLGENTTIVFYGDSNNWFAAWGVLLSGIHAGVLSGWIFLLACVRRVASGFSSRRG